jgi:hypothetical protein
MHIQRVFSDGKLWPPHAIDQLTSAEYSGGRLHQRFENGKRLRGEWKLLAGNRHLMVVGIQMHRTYLEHSATGDGMPRSP